MAGLSPLVKRVLTALLLMPLVVWGILALPTIYLAVLFGAVTLLGAWEWGGLSGLATPLAKASYVVLVALLLVAVGQLGSHPHTLLALFGTAVAGWCLVLLLGGGLLVGRLCVLLLFGWLDNSMNA